MPELPSSWVRMPEMLPPARDQGGRAFEHHRYAAPGRHGDGLQARGAEAVDRARNGQSGSPARMIARRATSGLGGVLGYAAQTVLDVIGRRVFNGGL